MKSENNVHLFQIHELKKGPTRFKPIRKEWNIRFHNDSFALFLVILREKFHESLCWSCEGNGSRGKAAAPRLKVFIHVWVETPFSREGLVNLTSTQSGSSTDPVKLFWAPFIKGFYIFLNRLLPHKLKARFEQTAGREEQNDDTPVIHMNTSRQNPNQQNPLTRP